MGIKVLFRKGDRGERRKSPRTRCRLHCSIRDGRRRIKARVLDVSEGGLCILSPVAFEPKRSFSIQIDVPTEGAVEVEAIAWHIRAVKSGTSLRKAHSIGMMISKAGPGFEALLPDVGRDARRSEADMLTSTLMELPLARPEQTELEQPVGEPAEEPLALPGPEQDATSGESLLIFRVRVRARVGPRTRTLTLGAVSVEEAKALAETDLGEEWSVLEVNPA